MMFRTLISMLLLCAGALGCTSAPVAKKAASPDRVVATVGNVPVYAVELDRLMTEQVKRIRNDEGIFARPSPEELALMRESLLHGLLLNAVYKQPDMTFSKSRATQYTREQTLATARAVREALLQGKPTQEVLDTYIGGIYKEPAQVKVDLLSTGQIQPAYKAEVFSTLPGDVTNIIEDPSGGYYILRIVSRETVSEGVERVQADSFFVSWDKDAGRLQVKEEDLAQSKVVILDATLKALTAIRQAADATQAGDAVREQEHLLAARAALEADPRTWQNNAAGQFLMGWISELQARDPSTGVTYETALTHYQQAVELQGQSAPGAPEYAFYLARAGEIQERLGDATAARDTYRLALDAAKDNMDLTLNLRAHFEKLNDTEYLAKAEVEIQRMGTASTYGRIQAGQKVMRTPGRMAEGIRGDAEIFEIEGVSQVVE